MIFFIFRSSLNIKHKKISKFSFRATNVTSLVSISLIFGGETAFNQRYFSGWRFFHFIKSRSCFPPFIHCRSSTPPSSQTSFGDIKSMLVLSLIYTNRAVKNKVWRSIWFYEHPLSKKLSIFYSKTSKKFSADSSIVKTFSKIFPANLQLNNLP